MLLNLNVRNFTDNFPNNKAQVLQARQYQQVVSNAVLLTHHIFGDCHVTDRVCALCDKIESRFLLFVAFWGVSRRLHRFSLVARMDSTQENGFVSIVD